uniref:DDE_Tnp_1_7 domain-containing protein n=1 Tax=Parastrongyloides trichosuri TaxID=131310 RepID=A0A0N5A2D8_PARTI
LNFDMDQFGTTLYSWRKSTANVVGYLQYKGVQTTVVEDYTVTLRNHSSQVSMEYCKGRVVITDAMKGWTQLRLAESVYDAVDLTRYNTIAPNDEDDHQNTHNISHVGDSDPNDDDYHPSTSKSRGIHGDTLPASKVTVQLAAESQKPDGYQDVMIPFMVSNVDVKKLNYLQLKEKGAENGKYTNEALLTMFNFVVFENCIWDEFSNEMVRKFLGRLKDYRKTNASIPTSRIKKTLKAFRTLRICACLMMSMKHLKIKKKRFLKNPENYIEDIKKGVADLGLKGTYRKGDHFAKTLKLLKHAVFYKYSIMEEYRSEHSIVYSLQKLHVV